MAWRDVQQREGAGAPTGASSSSNTRAIQNGRRSPITALRLSSRIFALGKTHIFEATLRKHRYVPFLGAAGAQCARRGRNAADQIDVADALGVLRLHEQRNIKGVVRKNATQRKKLTAETNYCVTYI
eukprot:2854329-Pleurochrysis_carterae.AAC.1